MNIDRALKLRDQAARRVRDAYSLARSCGLPSADINETVAAIFAELRERKTPQWVESYVSGYRQAITDGLNSEPGLIVYGGFWDGAFVSVNRNRPDYYQKRGLEPSAFAGMSDAGEIEALGLYWGAFDPPRVWFVGEQPREIRARLEAPADATD